MIIFHHLAIHGGAAIENTSLNSIALNIFLLGGKTGVNIFILITGYYSYKILKIKYHKLAHLGLKTTFYSVLLTIAAFITGSAAISKKILLKSFFPLIFGNGYWFIIIYFELCLLMPILNKVIIDLDKKEHEYFLLTGFIIFTVLPFVIQPYIEINEFGYSNLIWFIYIYFLGAYISKYNISDRFENKMLLSLLLIGSIFAHIVFSVLSSIEFGPSILKPMINSLASYNANAIFPLFISIIFMILFTKISIKENKLLASLGAATFGIYLFHDNANFKTFLWGKLFHIPELYVSKLFIPASFVVVIIIFIAGYLLDLIIEYIVNMVINLVEKKHIQNA